MGVSHIAIAVKDMQATHRFYSEAMGFELVKVEVVPQRGGFARHAFYSTGSSEDQLIAFWDLSRVPLENELKTDICRDLGLDPMTNHIAFSASDLDDIGRRRDRWLAAGHDVLEIDHGWITSIYTEDPDGITVEFAVLTQAFSTQDAAEALELLRAENPQPRPHRRGPRRRPQGRRLQTFCGLMRAPEAAPTRGSPRPASHPPDSRGRATPRGVSRSRPPACAAGSSFAAATASA